MYVRVVRVVVVVVVVVVVAVGGAGMRVGRLGIMAVRRRRRFIPLALVLADGAAQMIVTTWKKGQHEGGFNCVRSA